MQLFYCNMVVSFPQEINEFFRFLRYKTPRRISKTQRGDDFHLYNKVLGDVFLKLLALDQLLAAYKENEWTAVLFQHRVNAVYTDAGIDRRFFNSQQQLVLDRYNDFIFYSYSSLSVLCISSKSALNFFILLSCCFSGG